MILKSRKTNFLLVMAILMVVLLMISACSNDEAVQDEDVQDEVNENNEVASVYPDPEREFFINVPYNPGGSGDTIARMLAPYLSEELGIPVILEHIPGAGGAMGIVATLYSPDDGYQIVSWHSPGAETRAIAEEVSYDIKDFVPLGVVNADPYCIFVNADSEFKSIEQYLDAVKKGEANVGGTGPYGSGLVALKLAEKALDTKFDFIPFEGFSDAVAAVMGGHIDSGVLGTEGLLPFVEDGNLRVLTIFHDERLPDYPDVPTFEEATGEMVKIASTRGHVVRATTPPEVLEKLRDAYEKSVTNPKFIEDLEKRYNYVYYNVEQQAQLIKDYEKVIEGIFKEQ